MVGQVYIMLTRVAKCPYIFHYSGGSAGTEQTRNLMKTLEPVKGLEPPT